MRYNASTVKTDKVIAKREAVVSSDPGLERGRETEGCKAACFKPESEGSRREPNRSPAKRVRLGKEEERSGRISGDSRMELKRSFFRRGAA